MVRQACFLAHAGKQRVEGQSIVAPWEELIAIDEIEQRHRLAAQGMDHMAIVERGQGVAVCRWRPEPERTICVEPWKDPSRSLS